MRRLLPSLLFAAALAACDDGPAPGPGALTVTLESPHGQEGAARVRLVGPGIVSAAPLEGEIHTRTRGDTLSVLVLRPDAGVLRFTVQVQDTTRKPRGSLVQVAGPDNVVRSAVSGYRVAVAR